MSSVFVRAVLGRRVPLGLHFGNLILRHEANETTSKRCLGNCVPSSLWQPSLYEFVLLISAIEYQWSHISTVYFKMTVYYQPKRHFSGLCKSENIATFFHFYKHFPKKLLSLYGSSSTALKQRISGITGNVGLSFPKNPFPASEFFHNSKFSEISSMRIILLFFPESFWVWHSALPCNPVSYV